MKLVSKIVDQFIEVKMPSGRMTKPKLIIGTSEHQMPVATFTGIASALLFISALHAMVGEEMPDGKTKK